MANPERGEVALMITHEVDGQPSTKEYTLKLSMNAAVMLQNRRKKTIAEIVADIEKLDFASIRDIAFVLLQKYHAKEIDTVEKAGDVIDDAGGLAQFFAAFRQLMDVNKGPETDGVSHPPIAQPSTGAGSTLTPDVVN